MFDNRSRAHFESCASILASRESVLNAVSSASAFDRCRIVATW